jgi:hypothetical protein
MAWSRTWRHRTGALRGQTELFLPSPLPPPLPPRLLPPLVLVWALVLVLASVLVWALVVGSVLVLVLALVVGTRRATTSPPGHLSLRPHPCAASAV